MSFEAVLEAQLGVLPGLAAPFLPEAAKGDRPEADLEPTGDSQPAATSPEVAAAPFLFLPTALPATQTVVAPVQPGLSDLPVTARDERRGDAKALPPVPSALQTRLESLASEPVATAAQVPVKLAEPANFAAELQRLPAAGPANAAEPASSGQPALQAPLIPGAERRTDSLPPAQHAASAIPGTVGEQRWGDALSQRVVWMVGQQVRAAEFRVEPPQLGPIEVRLSITNDQANLTFSAPHSIARDAIQTALPRLQEMLQETGLTLGNVFVGAQMQQDSRDPATGGRDVSSGTGLVPAVREGGSLDVTVRRSIGLVDLYA